MPLIKHNSQLYVMCIYIYFFFSVDKGKEPFAPVFLEPRSMADARNGFVFQCMYEG